MPRQKSVHFNTPGPSRMTYCGRKLSEGWYTSIKDVVTCRTCLKAIEAKAE